MGLIRGEKLKTVLAYAIFTPFVRQSVFFYPYKAHTKTA